MPDDLLQPLSVRHGSRADVLYEGVPDHLRPALARWAQWQLGTIPDEQTGDELRGFVNGKTDRQNRLIDVLASAHVAVPRTSSSWLVDDIALMIEDPGDGPSHRADDILDLVDMHLQVCGGGALELTHLLRVAGSAWTVGGLPLRLLCRVADEQQSQFEAATSCADPASGLLSQAWSKTYGRHPDPTHAWSEAVKAVEVLLAPIVAPKDKRPQLGKMIGTITQAPEKWATALQREKVATLDVFTDMLRVIYPNPGRHDDDVATQAEAEAAVGMAVLVVSWLRTGSFRRVSSPTGSPESP